MRIEATKQRATATRLMRGKRFEHGRRRTSLTSVLLCLLTVQNHQLARALSGPPIMPPRVSIRRGLSYRGPWAFFSTEERCRGQAWPESR
jgi:hypothetical protein